MSTDLSIPHAGLFKVGLGLMVCLSIALTILGAVSWAMVKKTADSTEKTHILRCAKGTVGCAGIVLFFNILFFMLYRKNF
jgi:hypothetical protein